MPLAHALRYLHLARASRPVRYGTRMSGSLDIHTPIYGDMWHALAHLCKHSPGSEFPKPVRLRAQGTRERSDWLICRRKAATSPVHTLHLRRAFGFSARPARLFRDVTLRRNLKIRTSGLLCELFHCVPARSLIHFAPLIPMTHLDAIILLFGTSQQHQ